MLNFQAETHRIFLTGVEPVDLEESSAPFTWRVTDRMGTGGRRGCKGALGILGAHKEEQGVRGAEQRRRQDTKIPRVRCAPGPTERS